MQREVVIAGSTGSIGTQAIDVARRTPDRFRVVAIGANSAVDVLVDQARELRPRVVALADASREAELRERLDASVELRTGPDALASLVDFGDTVVNAVVGFAGLDVTLGALAAGKRLALANKESLVAGGQLVARVRSTPGAELLPVDSEHGALHQCMRAGSRTEIASMTLTASGGPFRGKTLRQLRDVSVGQALDHPTWKMGPKITIDSSTLFNKGLEVIEAAELFGLDYDQIGVVVHPQSIVHSAVEYCDGSSLAQLSRPDMRLPIGYAMGYPDRLDVPFGSLDWATLGSLDFEEPDRETFRCLDLCYRAGREGGAAPAVLNAANEVAVQAFLDERVTWVEIPAIIEEALDRRQPSSIEDVKDLLAADNEARRSAHELVAQRT